MTSHQPRKLLPPIEPMFDDGLVLEAIQHAGGGTHRQREAWVRRLEHDLLAAERAARMVNDPVLRDRIRHIRTIVSRHEAHESFNGESRAWRDLWNPDQYADERES